MANLIKKQKHKTILHDDKFIILRNIGGLGDILMHRMLFEDIKLQNFNKEVIFACPQQYHAAIEDHPFIDKVIDSKSFPREIFHYNTTNTCHKYEIKKAPFSDKHRSDIWANHCGIILKNHNMHINLKNEFIDFGLKVINKKPSVIFNPISAIKSKNLNKNKMQDVALGLMNRGLNVFSCHTEPIPELSEIGVSVIYGINIKQWMGIISAADYVVSVDTSSLHFAGGINKPTLGIFTWADGKVYCKYYENCITVQKHRDDKDWDCGPCYNWGLCPKSKNTEEKPCLTELTSEMILDGFDRLVKKQKAQNLSLLHEKIVVIN